MFDETLSTAVAAARRDLELARLRLLVRFEPPPKVQDFGSLYNPASYRADLQTRRLELLWNGTPRYEGPLRVIGTWRPEDRSWLWAWHNGSVPAEACDEARRVCEGLEALGSLRTQARFACEAREADLLARYVAHAAGWFGVHAAEHPGQPVTFLGVVDLRPAETTTYCGFCFGNETDGPILRAAPGMGICGRCVQKAADILGEPASGEASSDPLGGACFLCGGDSARLLHGSHAAVCAGCVAFARSALSP